MRSAHLDRSRSAGSAFSAPAALALLTVLAGCFRTAPVLDVHDAVMPYHEAVADDPVWVHDVLVQALALKTWTIEQDEPGKIIASVSAGGHSARVMIRYDGSRYSIQHVDSSEGLLYDGYEIHKRYNHWISRLQTAISHIAADRMAAQAPSALPPQGETDAQPLPPPTPLEPSEVPPPLPAADAPGADPTTAGETAPIPDDDSVPAPPPLPPARPSQPAGP